VRGVEISNKHLGRVTVRAGEVVASGDVKEVLLRLVEPGALAQRTRSRASGWKMAPALGALYLGVRQEALGGRSKNTNYWVYPRWDLEREYANTEAGGFSPEPFLFVSSASLKDPENPRLAPAGVVNLQLMSLAPSAPEAWGTTPDAVRSGAYRDDAAYLSAKAEYSERLLRAAERVFPGLAGHVVFQELATPLTHARFTSSTGGTSYGIAATPDQFLWRRPGPKTEIAGLYLCGASARSGHGIMGSMLGGVIAASTIAGGGLARAALGGARAADQRAKSAPGDSASGSALLRGA
jgi:phytoene dehydrogenase-like protein